MGQLLEYIDDLIAHEKWVDAENYFEEVYEDDVYIIDDTKEVLYSTLQEDWSPKFEKGKEKVK